MFFNTDKETFCGRYKGIEIYGFGSVIGNNWYGEYYCKKLKNKRRYKVKESISKSIEELKLYINKNIDNLK